MASYCQEASVLPHVDLLVNWVSSQHGGQLPPRAIDPKEHSGSCNILSNLALGVRHCYFHSILVVTQFSVRPGTMPGVDTKRWASLEIISKGGCHTFPSWDCISQHSLHLKSRVMSSPVDPARRWCMTLPSQGASEAGMTSPLSSPSTSSCSWTQWPDKDGRTAEGAWGGRHLPIRNIHFVF